MSRLWNISHGSTSVTKNSMRGLTQYITEIRNAANKGKEDARVSKEMAKIRKKFKEANLDGYNRRKYVAKLLYTYVFGYEVDFGFMEAVGLMTSSRFQEKLIGYLACSVLLHENHEMTTLIVQSLQTDLKSLNQSHQLLALAALGNMGGKEATDALATTVQKMLLSPTSSSTVKKKAALALLRLFKRNKEFVTPDPWAGHLCELLENASGDLGEVGAIMTLLLGVVSIDSRGFEKCVKSVLGVLTKVIIKREFTKDYIYYNIANPWLQVKCLRFLSHYPTILDDSQRSRLNEIIKKILNSADIVSIKGQTFNHKNSLNSVLFEAIDLVTQLETDRDLLVQASKLLGRFIGSKEVNIKYLTLRAMKSLTTLDTESAALVRNNQDTILAALQDGDISIRKRALDLLYCMCDKDNATEIVSELLTFVSKADFSILDELVLKISILAEKFARRYSWYLDVMLQLIGLAGDYVSDDAWHRVVQIVANKTEVREYACKAIYKALLNPACHEIVVKLGAFVLSEYGGCLVNSGYAPPAEQFQALHTHFTTVGSTTKAMLMSGYVKFGSKYPSELNDSVTAVFESHERFIDTEIQQRACEYLHLHRNSNSGLKAQVLEAMPAYVDDKDVLHEVVEDDEALLGELPSTTPKPQAQQSQRTLDDIFGLDDDQDEADQPSTSPPVIEGIPQFAEHQQPPVVDGLPQYSPNQTATAQTSEPTIEDLLGLSVSPPTTTQSSSSTALESILAPSSAQILEPQELLPEEPSATQPEEPEPAQQLLQPSTRKVCSSLQGVIYQDEHLQIGFKSEYQKSAGRMMLYYGNVGTIPLSSFVTAIAPTGYLRTSIQPVASIVGAAQQVHQLFNMSCVREFTEYPRMQIGFLKGGKTHNISVKLPINFAKFLEPLELAGPAFFQKWKSIEGPPNEAQTITKPPNGNVDMDHLNKVLGEELHFAVLKNVDPNSNNLVAAGTFWSEGQPFGYFALVRIETNSQAHMYRITTRTPAAGLTSAISKYLATME